ncbi:GAF domain-containing protein [Ramlibacter sp. MMS24-I3-19]|uniref:GAF domain-containing protein n=1 Tax=Ramlibacter sp. MMS24-I3-19 TaxID=3416606 RepID=UPI003CFCF8BA
MDSLLLARQKIADLIAQDQVRDALRYMNGLTSYRFSAVYRFGKDQLSSRVFYDRERPDMLSTETIPVEASYCIYVRNHRGPFLLADSLRDDRVVDHAKRAEVRSYCGVPLVDDRGWMHGSLCHFDYEPHPLRETDFMLLQEIAPLLVPQAAGRIVASA